nr:small integral membrane protein 20 [Manis javanica]
MTDTTDEAVKRKQLKPHPSRPGSESRSSSSERGHGPTRASAFSESAGRTAGQGRSRPGTMSRNLRTALIFGGFVSLIGAAFYPIYFRPLMRLEEYQKEQAVNRAGIVQEDVQPPGLKVWSDPFGRK